MKARVVLRDVSKSFGGVKVLDGISLEVREGEVFAIVGPNGVGKTTLLKIIAGVLKPDAGEVRVEGSVGYVPQGDSLLPWRTIWRNIALPLELAGIDGAEARERVRSVAEELGISRYLDMYPREVSGGTRRKAAIARALVSGPDVLLLDEPYAGLDLSSTRSTNEAISRLARGGKAIVLVSHQLEEAAEVADRAALIAGRPARIVATVDLAGLGPEARSSRLRELAMGARWG
mgnify:FL=1